MDMKLNNYESASSKGFICQQCDHQEQVLGFCLNFECIKVAHFCSKCLIYDKHYEHKDDCKTFNDIQAIIEQELLKRTTYIQMLEQYIDILKQRAPQIEKSFQNKSGDLIEKCANLICKINKVIQHLIIPQKNTLQDLIKNLQNNNYEHLIGYVKQLKLFHKSKATEGLEKTISKLIIEKQLLMPQNEFIQKILKLMGQLQIINQRKQSRQQEKQLCPLQLEQEKENHLIQKYPKLNFDQNINQKKMIKQSKLWRSNNKKIFLSLYQKETIDKMPFGSKIIQVYQPNIQSNYYKYRFKELILRKKFYLLQLNSRMGLKSIARLKNRQIETVTNAKMMRQYQISLENEREVGQKFSNRPNYKLNIYIDPKISIYPYQNPLKKRPIEKASNKNQCHKKNICIHNRFEILLYPEKLSCIDMYNCEDYCGYIESETEEEIEFLILMVGDLLQEFDKEDSEEIDHIFDSNELDYNEHYNEPNFDNDELYQSLIIVNIESFICQKLDIVNSYEANYENDLQYYQY